MSYLFADYIDDMEFHFGLESLRQILKEAKMKGSLPFIMDGDDFVLIKDFSLCYLRPIYMFKNSKHIFDNGESIVGLLSEYKIMDGSKELNNFVFVDSTSNQLIKLSDVLVGFVGKLCSYLNTNSRVQIRSDFCSLNQLQRENIDLLLRLIDRSHDRNIGFLHSTDAYEEMSKVEFAHVELSHMHNKALQPAQNAMRFSVG
jgi:hypothetical protein